MQRKAEGEKLKRWTQFTQVLVGEPETDFAKTVQLWEAKAVHWVFIPHHSEAYSSTILFLSWLLARQLDFWAWMLYHLSHFLQLYHLKSGFERASVPTTQVKEFFSPGSQLGSYLSRAWWGHNVSNQQLGGFIWVSLPIQCNVHPQHFVNSCHLFNSKAQWKVQYQVFNRRNKTFTNQTKGQTAPKK